MLRKCVQISLLLLIFVTVPLAAQLTDISDTQSFSHESVMFDFEGLSPNTHAGPLLSDWGITFQTGNESVPTVISVFVLGFSNLVVSNVPSTGDSSEHPLVINFRYPVSRVGFVARNGTESTTVTIRAFDQVGTELGSVEHSGLAGPTTLAVSTTNPQGIAKLSISYGGDQDPEQIDELRIEYVSRPEFVTYLAQVGDGPIPGGSVLRTVIVVSNLSNSTAEGAIDFFGDDGEPLTLQIGAHPAYSLLLSIPPLSSKTLTTRGETVAVGYARIRSNVPVEATSIFRILSDTGSVISEAGVGGATGSSTAVGVVQKFTAGNFDSGIAIVNTADQQAAGRVELYKQDGTLFAVNSDIASLVAKGHVAQFLTQIFPEVDNQPFEGTIRVVSDVPLAVVILRTSGGIVMSSLPVGSLEN